MIEQSKYSEYKCKHYANHCSSSHNQNHLIYCYHSLWCLWLLIQWKTAYDYPAYGFVTRTSQGVRSDIGPSRPSSGSGYAQLYTRFYAKSRYDRVFPEINCEKVSFRKRNLWLNYSHFQVPDGRFSNFFMVFVVITNSFSVLNNALL